MSIILFPGQGSQFVGMGKKLLNVPQVSRMFDIANEIFKTNLLSLCLDGPKSELDKTKHSQAAVFVTSLAAVEYLKQTNPNALNDCYATAGFSIGEYASLVFAGSLNYADALRIIKVRSEAMQDASERSPSGMMSAFVNRQSELNLAMLAARKWCLEKLRMPADRVECSIANYLFARVKVIGGNEEALKFIELNRQEFKIDRLQRLPVSGAFHTGLMRPATLPLHEILLQTEIKKPRIKCYSNCNAKPYENVREIRRLLVKQVYYPVKWEQILNQLLYDKNLPVASESKNEIEISQEQSKDRLYPEIYECGPAGQSSAILRSINMKAHRFYRHIDT